LGYPIDGKLVFYNIAGGLVHSTYCIVWRTRIEELEGTRHQEMVNMWRIRLPNFTNKTAGIWMGIAFG
jgi:hypothetical protein